MAQQARIRSIYSGRFKEPLIDLLSDPLSEVARARQAALLIAASLSLLLSTGLAKISESGAGNTKVALLNPQHANKIVFAVTAYLLVIYALAAFADWSVASVKRLAADRLLKDVEATMDSDQLERIDRDTARVRRMREISSQVDKLLADKQAATEPMNNRIDELAKAGPERLATDEFVDLTEKVHQINKGFHARIDPLTDEMTILGNQADLSQWFALKADQEVLQQSRTKFSLLARSRLAIEILFPVVYALVAIVLALRYW